MSSMTLKSLVEKMNDSTRQALEGAVGQCFQRTHHTVETEHLLKALLQSRDEDLALVFEHFGLSLDRLEDQLNEGLESFRTGSGATPSLSPRLVDLLRQCWLDTSIEFGEPAMRGATLLYTLLNDTAMAALATRHARELERLDPQQLLSSWAHLRDKLGGSEAAEPRRPAGRGKEEHLAQFTIDLTGQAREGKLDPVLGRDDEIRQMIDILTRRRQNNPILTGEAGVGKTAVVEGLAQRIADGSVPEALKKARLLTLDLALLQAGAGVKGEFENRLKGVIEEVKNSVDPVILFIDEAHNMVGAGGQAGQNDAANLLKPALARGELRTIAATTWAEYKKFFEKDAALTRRFQVVKVDEPSEDIAIQILRGLAPTLEKHHGVIITDAAVGTAVRLSMRFLAGRQLPDKAVALLDTCCARVAMSQASMPTLLEKARAELAALELEDEILARESRTGADHSRRLEELADRRQQAEEKVERLEKIWQTEQTLVASASELGEKLSEEADEELRSELNELRAQLAEREQPMVHWQVDSQLVSEVLSDWTGIPMGRMQADEVAGILKLDQNLKTRVKGQDHALDLAEQVYGSESNLTVINMSEFKEEHKVSQLVGSPPGYVGYGEGGVLTEAVRRKPYSVILLDEMEKAHPGVQDIFYQVFDKGSLRDGEGQDVDFRNTVILMTSNAGSEQIADLYADEMTAPEDPKTLKVAIWDQLLDIFKPAFLGRTTVLPYRPLGRDQLAEITRLQLERINQRLLRHHDVALGYDDGVVDAVVERCTEASSGARNIQQILHRDVLPAASRKILECLADETPITAVDITVNDGDLDVVVSTQLVSERQTESMDGA